MTWLNLKALLHCKKPKRTNTSTPLAPRVFKLGSIHNCGWNSHTCTSRIHYNNNYYMQSYVFRMFWQKKMDKKIGENKTAFGVCDHPCHSRLLLVSINPWPWPWPFFSQCFTVGNDGHCWRFDGLKESIEVDSSTMELWSVCAKGTLWSPILHTFPINLPLVFEAIL